MMNEQRGTLLLMDHEGNYYLLTPALLAQARVPKEQVPELEQLLASQDETAGFSGTRAKKPWLTTQAGSLGFSFALLAQQVFTPSVPPPDEDEPS